MHAARHTVLQAPAGRMPVRRVKAGQNARKRLARSWLATGETSVRRMLSELADTRAAASPACSQWAGPDSGARAALDALRVGSRDDSAAQTLGPTPRLRRRSAQCALLHPSTVHPGRKPLRPSGSKFKSPPARVNTDAAVLHPAELLVTRITPLAPRT